MAEITVHIATDGWQRDQLIGVTDRRVGRTLHTATHGITKFITVPADGSTMGNGFIKDDCFSISHI
jgi:hypothetical protein